MTELWNSLMEDFTSYVPSLLAALAVLVVGWIIALVASTLVRKLLQRTSVDNKLATWLAGKEGKPVPLEAWAAKGTFYLVMLLVLIGFFQALRLTVVTEPLKDLLGSFFDYIPRLVAGAVLILVAWVVATLARRLVAGALKAAKLDERLGAAAPKEGEAPPALSTTLAEVVYWITFLIFLPAILGALDMVALLDPVNEMMRKFFAFLPNLIAAVVFFLVGWMVARIAQRLVTSLLGSAGADQLAAKWGFEKGLGTRKLSELAGLVVQFVILIPVLIEALDQLQLTAITEPATNMLDKILQFLPTAIAAALILIIAWVVGQVVCGLIESLLTGIGFNKVLVKLGLAKQVPEGKSAPAAIVGMLLLIGIMLAAVTSAAETLGFDRLSALLHQFLGFAGEVLLGVIVFGLGLFLAQIVFSTLQTSDSPRAKLLAWVSRVAIIILAGAMSLRATGVADSIVNLAFGALVCGLAAAGAIAFGFGGRKAAAEQLTKWRESSGQR